MFKTLVDLVEAADMLETAGVKRRLTMGHGFCMKHRVHAILFEVTVLQVFGCRFGLSSHSRGL